MAIRYVDLQGVLVINKDLMTPSSQPTSVMQKGNLCYCLDSAMNILPNSNSDEISYCVKIASFYIWCIGSAHIFIEGNKRTAYQVGYVFLLANGYKLTGVSPPDIISLMTGITMGTNSKNDVEKWIARYIKPIYK